MAKTREATTCGSTGSKPENKSSTAKAKASKTNRKRSEAAKQQPRTEDGTKLAEKPGATTTCGKTCNQYAGSTVKAKASKTNRKRSEAAKGNQNAAKDKDRENSATTTCGRTESSTSTRTGTKAKAAASKTNRGTVERMDRLELFVGGHFVLQQSFQISRLYLRDSAHSVFPCCSAVREGKSIGWG